MTGTRLHRAAFPVMGTQASLVGRMDRPDFARLVRIARHCLTAADRRFSPFATDSELSRLRRGADSQPSADMRRVLAGCRLLATLTDGAFQPRDPGGTIDTTGFVKGWAMRQVELRARAAGLGDWLLSVGGDVVATGRNGDRPWQVALRHPAHPGRVAEVIRLQEAGVATSGDYERGAHVWRPGAAPGGPPRPRGGSVTVVGPRIDVADALATAVWAQGDPRPAWLERLPQYTVLAIMGTDSQASPGFPLVA